MSEQFRGIYIQPFFFYLHAINFLLIIIAVVNKKKNYLNHKTFS